MISTEAAVEGARRDCQVGYNKGYIRGVGSGDKETRGGGGGGACGSGSVGNDMGQRSPKGQVLTVWRHMRRSSEEQHLRVKKVGERFDGVVIAALELRSTKLRWEQQKVRKGGGNVSSQTRGSWLVLFTRK